MHVEFADWKTLSPESSQHSRSQTRVKKKGYVRFWQISIKNSHSNGFETHGAWTLNLFISGFISSLPQLDWEKRRCCCCCWICSSHKLQNESIEQTKLAIDLPKHTVLNLLVACNITTNKLAHRYPILTWEQQAYDSSLYSCTNGTHRLNPTNPQMNQNHTKIEQIWHKSVGAAPVHTCA